MKTIKLKQSTIDPNNLNYLSAYLESLGIEKKDVLYFTMPSRFEPQWNGIVGDNPHMLRNLQAAVDKVREHLNMGSQIFIQVDSDVDGFTSSAILYNYMKRRYPAANIRYRLHEGKQHGLILSTVPEGTKLIIVPDAGSMQIEELTAASQAGYDVVVLDHHEYDETTSIPNVIIVNSQQSDFSNHSLSGAGVAFMFIKLFDEGSMIPVADVYMDLAALGIISDVMDSRVVGNQILIFHGLHNIRNKLFRELLLKQSFKIPDPTNPTKIDIAFYIAPLINGLIRSGSQEEKEFVFSTMLEDGEDETFESTTRNGIRVETKWQKAARLAANAKSRQDAAKKKMITFLCKKIDKEKLADHKILLVALNEKESEEVNPNIVGLAAMDIAKKYNRPTLILRYACEEDGVVYYTGSGRSNNYTDFPSFKAFLEETGLCMFVAGHANAFGAAVLSVNRDELIKVADEKLANINYDDSVVEVDYYFKGIINTALLEAFASASFLWGNLIPEPLFAFDFTVGLEDVMVMGANESTMKIRKSGVDFLMFNAKEIIDQLQANGRSNVTLIGTPAINEWMGKRTVQIKITDIVVNKAQISILSDLI